MEVLGAGKALTRRQKWGRPAHMCGPIPRSNKHRGTEVFNQASSKDCRRVLRAAGVGTFVQRSTRGSDDLLGEAQSPWWRPAVRCKMRELPRLLADGAKLHATGAVDQLRSTHGFPLKPLLSYKSGQGVYNQVLRINVMCERVVLRCTLAGWAETKCTHWLQLT